MRTVINFIIFQAAWFITVAGAGAGMPWAGPVFTLLWLVVHLSLFTDRPFAELNMLLSCAVVGYIADSLLVLTALVKFPEATQLGMPSTLWMVALWINLGMTLNISLAWLAKFPWLAALFGLIGGPLAYYLGSKLAAIVLLQDVFSLLNIGLMWALAMPVLFLINQYFHKHKDKRDLVSGSPG